MVCNDENNHIYSVTVKLLDNYCGSCVKENNLTDQPFGKVHISDIFLSFDSFIFPYFVHIYYI
jgi:hypothetical protein